MKYIAFFLLFFSLSAVSQEMVFEDPDKSLDSKDKRYKKDNEFLKKEVQFFLNKKQNLEDLVDAKHFIEVYFELNSRNEIVNKKVGYFTYDMPVKTDKNGKVIYSKLTKEFKELPEGIRKKIFKKLKKYNIANDLLYNSNSNYWHSVYVNSRKLPKKKNSKAIEEAFECTMPDTVKQLDLSGLNLKKVPKVIYRFNNLEILNLANNNLKKLPGKVSKIKSLKSLEVSSNKLIAKKVKFTENSNIEIVNLINNYLNTVPAKVNNNKGLKLLMLANNPIYNIDDLDASKVKNLEVLNLYNCYLNELPSSISEFSNLQELDLYYNNLSGLPKSIKEVKALKTLAVSNNSITKLPTELAELPNLKTFYAHHNFLSSINALPSSLSLLDIGYNDFNEMPTVIDQLTSLESLDISFNKLTEVPLNLLESTTLKKVFMFENPFTKEIAYSDFSETLEKKNVFVR